MFQADGEARQGAVHAESGIETTRRWSTPTSSWIGTQAIDRRSGAFVPGPFRQSSRSVNGDARPATTSRCGRADAPLAIRSVARSHGRDNWRLRPACCGTGSDDVLYSVFPVIPFVAAAVGASMLAATHLGELRRSGAPLRVSNWIPHIWRAPSAVSVTRAVTVAWTSVDSPRCRASPHRRRLAPAARELYPWHRERLLGVIGSSEEPVAVAEAISHWRTEELETAIAEGGAAQPPFAQASSGARTCKATS